MIPLDGKRALVCGSTQGIGRACALEFARLGAQVTLLARDAAALDRVREELASASGKNSRTVHHASLRADFSDSEAVRSVVKRHLEATGPVAILLNNTGGPPPGPIADAAPEAFEAAFAAHLICNQILAQLVVPGMRKIGYGRILNIISSSVKQPIPGLGVSNTIRGAVASWAKTLSGELAPFGITVNNILPGCIDTQRLRAIIRDRAGDTDTAEADVEGVLKRSIPMGRFGTPEELAAAAGFLASPAAGYITGVSLPVDGGRITSL